MEINLTTIIGLITVLVTFVLGILSKRSKFIKNNLIPVQNLIIGVIAFVVNYIITKDINASLIGVGLFTGGTYDLVHNLQEIRLIEDAVEYNDLSEGENETNGNN